ncbi:hypothetical protein HZF08_29560 [Paenibacillus sp. CGMCC 1.16610]|nr:hypothetical protein [Paenibacillus sp. CGMCC 1.16610]
MASYNLVNSLLFACFQSIKRTGFEKVAIIQKNFFYFLKEQQIHPNINTNEFVHSTSVKTKKEGQLAFFF